MNTLNNQLIILGIDPGYDRIGWAIGKGLGSKPEIIDFGCIQTDKTKDLSDRYQSIENQLQKIIEQYQPHELAIETLFFSKNKKTALQVSEARGIILSCCTRNKLGIFEYYPNQIKLTVTGNGQANKAAMEKMIRLQLNIPRKKIIDDAIDAIGIVLTHAVTRR
jgi:crossover junction endodeoxyribonuclease RuvC